MNKKLPVLLAAAALCTVAFARPHAGPRHYAPHRHHAPRFHHHHHHHHRSHRGCFWPGFVGGVVGGVLTDALIGPRVVAAPTTIVTTPAVVTTPTVVTAPTVVAAPAVQTQNVWVEGRYVDQVQPNGTVVRVWQPGHYEQRTLVVQ